MEDPGTDVAKIFEQREREFLLSPVRVIMKTSTEEMEVGDLVVAKTKEGERVEMPRWVAEELVDLELAEMQEEPFDVEIFKALDEGEDTRIVCSSHPSSRTSTSGCAGGWPQSGRAWRRGSTGARTTRS